jgi:hypothetical protein
VYALIVSAKNEKEAVATIGQKFRVDVIRFIVGSVRFRNCYRRAPTAGTRYNTPSSSVRTRLCRRGSRWHPRDLLLHRSFRLASSGIDLFQLGIGIKTNQLAIGRPEERIRVVRFWGSSCASSESKRRTHRIADRYG